MNDDLPDLDRRLRWLAADTEGVPLPAASTLRSTGSRRRRRRRLRGGLAAGVLLAGVGIGVGIDASAGGAPHHQALRVVGPHPATTTTTSLPPTTPAPTTTIPATTVPAPTTTTPPTIAPTTTTHPAATTVPATLPSTTTTTVPPADLPVVTNCDPGQGPATAIRPGDLDFACADGVSGVSSVTWTSWTTTGATGFGIHYKNDCEPDCAQGTFSRYPVEIHLSDPEGGTCDPQAATCQKVFYAYVLTPTTSAGKPDSGSGYAVGFSYPF